MWVKVKNYSSFLFHISHMVEYETLEEPETMWRGDVTSIHPQSKRIIGSFQVPPNLPAGKNVLLWVTLSFEEHLSQSERLCLKVRFLKSSLGSQVLHTIASQPFGNLRPEQEWHGGHASHSTAWSTSIGSFELKFNKKFYGISLVIKQVCRSSSTTTLTSDLERPERVAIWENQGRGSALPCLASYGSSPGALRGRDPFTGEDGKVRPALDAVECPLDSVWCGSWSIDEQSIGTGAFGWMYAGDWDGPWHTASSLFSRVRRRKWVRSYCLPRAAAGGAIPAPPVPVVLDADKMRQPGRAPELWFMFERLRFLKTTRADTEKLGVLKLSPSILRHRSYSCALPANASMSAAERIEPNW